METGVGEFDPNIIRDKNFMTKNIESLHTPFGDIPVFSALEFSISGLCNRKCVFCPRADPKIFHMTDGSLKTEIDEHFNFEEGEYDLKFFIECIKNSNSRPVTIETSRRNINSFQEDLNNLNILKSL